jgi:hypothetical protein
MFETNNIDARNANKGVNFPHDDGWYRRLALCAIGGQLRFNEVLRAMHLTIYGYSLNSEQRDPQQAEGATAEGFCVKAGEAGGG